MKMIVPILLVVAYLVIDYLNVLSFCGIKVERINDSMLAIFVENIIVVTIALLTYYYIDKQNVARQKNQEKSASLLLSSIYANCKENVELFDDSSIAEMLIKKTDFDKCISEDDPVRKLEASAFASENYVMEAFMNGIFTKEQMEQYMLMKSTYCKYMTLRTVLFDAPGMYGAAREDFDKAYSAGIANI